MVVMSVCVALPIIPAMLRAFAATPDIGFLAPTAVVLPTLTIAFSSLAAGAIGDRIGRRRLLDWSTLLFAIAAIVPFWLTSFTWILVSRAIVGLALGAMATSAVALTGDYFQGAARQRWLAIQGAAGAGSAVVVSAISGALGEISWRLPFLLLASGFVLFLGLLVFRGPAAAASGAVIEESAEQPFAPLPWATLTAIFALGVFTSLIIWPPVYAFGVLLQEKGIGSVMLTGLMTAVLAAGAVAGAMSLGLLRRMAPPAKQAVAIAASGVGIVLVWTAGTLAPIMVGAFAIGIGQGMTPPILADWLLDQTPVRLRGRVVGLYQTIFFLAQFAGPLFARWVADASGGTTASMLYYAVASALLVVPTAAVLLMPRAPESRPAT
jgi:MFS family permease